MPRRAKVNVDVYNVLGERIMSRTMNSNGVQTIDMSGMNNGALLLQHHRWRQQHHPQGDAEPLIAM
ncbi:MAG: hypothetical protein IPG74_05535 [Flavobacteriales bacterium]|nr:hypothetical protein [Flavobacteriales bacterium]